MPLAPPVTTTVLSFTFMKRVSLDCDENESVVWFLAPAFDGAIYSMELKEALGTGADISWVEG